MPTATYEIDTHYHLDEIKSVLIDFRNYPNFLSSIEQVDINLSNNPIWEVIFVTQLIRRMQYELRLQLEEFPEFVGGHKKRILARKLSRKPSRKPYRKLPESSPNAKPHDFVLGRPCHGERNFSAVPQIIQSVFRTAFWDEKKCKNLDQFFERLIFFQAKFSLGYSLVDNGP